MMGANVKQLMLDEYATDVRQVYLSLLKSGFKTDEAFELTKAHIHSVGVVYLQNAMDNAKKKSYRYAAAKYFNKEAENNAD